MSFHAWAAYRGAMRNDAFGVAPCHPSFDALPEMWQACIELALEALRAGSLPIGAVVVAGDGRIVARGRNRFAEAVEASPHLPGTPYLTGTPLAHAEVNALLEYGYRPPGPRPVLYTTTEPCPLCMGAARMVGVGHVVYASRSRRVTSSGSSASTWPAWGSNRPPPGGTAPTPAGSWCRSGTPRSSS